MHKRWRNAPGLGVVKNGQAKAERPSQSLDHESVKGFLAKFAEAILVDQKRIDLLPKDQFHPDYDDEMWQRNRSDHVDALVRLTLTVEDMSMRLLHEVTALSREYRPALIKQPFLDSISDLATGARLPWLHETSSLFFTELIQQVRRKEAVLAPKGNPVELMLRWFDYDDPIKISTDVECEYSNILASHINQEDDKAKRILARQGRSAFEESLMIMTEVDRLIKEGKLFSS